MRKSKNSRPKPQSAEDTLNIYMYKVTGINVYRHSPSFLVVSILLFKMHLTTCIRYFYFIIFSITVLS